jgi:hypothetical protein
MEGANPALDNPTSYHMFLFLVESLSTKNMNPMKSLLVIDDGELMCQSCLELNDEEHTNCVQFKDGSTKTGAIKNQSMQASISVMSLQLIIPTNMPPPHD